MSGKDDDGDDPIDLRKLAPESAGYHHLPGSSQSPTSPFAVDTSKWEPCPACGKRIPVQRVFNFETQHDIPLFTAVCPFCRHVTIGAPNSGSCDWTSQATCHDCGVPLMPGAPCGNCGLPRAWMTSKCPFCGVQQAVHMPHWVVHCDLCHFECVSCMNKFISLCIC